MAQVNSKIKNRIHDYYKRVQSELKRSAYFRISAYRAGSLVIVIILLASNVSSSQKLITPGYQFNSDPTCREINGRFYLFTTQDPFTVQFEKNNEKFKGMYDYHAFSTTDFDNWTDHGSILNTHDAGWHKGNAVWDGDAGIPANGKYYAYIPFRKNPDTEDNYGYFEIGVLVADKPEGPYTDPLGKPMSMPNGENLKGLSPTVVLDDSGDPYLIWGAGDWKTHYVLMAKLKPNMIEFADSVREIKVEVINKCGGIEYYESPILFKRNDIWYLTYIAFKDRGGRNCNFGESEPGGSYIRYATSTSMFGPFDKDQKHLIYPIYLNNHQGICQYKGEWYIAYHTTYQNIHRQACVTKLNFNEDGSLKLIYPEKDMGAGTPGVSNLVLDAFANKREAEEFHARLNADDEMGVLWDYHFKMREGGYLRFNNMDFGNGAAGFKVEVSCENENLKDGKIEFRLDNPYGRKIGEANVLYTKGKTNYVVLSGPVSGASGVHDICLVASGSGGDEVARLFNVNWFTFTRTYNAEERPLHTVNCGGPSEDGLSGDQPFVKGGWGYEGKSVTQATTNTIYYNGNLPNAMKSGRSSSSAKDAFNYKFTVPDGNYKIELYFTETTDTTYNDHKFDVSINGKNALSGFDVVRAAGGSNRAVMKEFDNIHVQNKIIDIAFIPKATKAMVSAIKIYNFKR